MYSFLVKIPSSIGSHLESLVSTHQRFRGGDPISFDAVTELACTAYLDEAKNNRLIIPPASDCDMSLEITVSNTAIAERLDELRQAGTLDAAVSFAYFKWFFQAGNWIGEKAA